MINPVHQNENGKWYFWDELWAFEEGPFDTEDAAKIGLNKYYKEILGETR